MKNLIFILFVICLGTYIISAQTSRNKRVIQKNTIQKTDADSCANAKQQREKFDPKRDPNVDLKNALFKAKNEKKRIILDIGGEWCVWCVRMDNFFLENPALTKMRDRKFIWVKINFSPENENRAFLSKYPEVLSYPHLFVLDTDGSLLHSQRTKELQEFNDLISNPSEKIEKENVTTNRKKNDYDLYNFVQFLSVWEGS